MRKLITVLFACVIFVPACGARSGQGKPLTSAEWVKKLETRMTLARQAVSTGGELDFEDLEKVMMQCANAAKGSKSEADAGKLVQKIREMEEKSRKKASKDEIKKDFAELETIVAAIKAAQP